MDWLRFSARDFNQSIARVFMSVVVGPARRMSGEPDYSMISREAPRVQEGELTNNISMGRKIG
jgi:hypothetical protein